MVIILKLMHLWDFEISVVPDAFAYICIMKIIQNVHTFLKEQEVLCL